MLVPGKKGTVSGCNCVVTPHWRIDAFTAKKQYLLEFDDPTGWAFRSVLGGQTTTTYNLAIGKYYFWMDENNPDFKVNPLGDSIPDTIRSVTGPAPTKHVYRCHRCNTPNEYVNQPNMTNNRWLCFTCHDFSWLYRDELLL